MKKRTWIIIAAVIAVAIIAFFLIKGCGHGPKPDIIAAKDSTQFWKNEAGQLIASMKQREADYNKISAAWKDSVEKLNNTKFKLVNMVAVLSLKGNTSLPAAIPPEIIYKEDTSSKECPPQIASIVQPYESKWYKSVDSINLVNSGLSRLHLETKDSIWLVEKVVEEGGLFNKRSYLQFDAYNANPDNRINSLNIYRKPLPKQKRWGISGQAGVTYIDKIRPYVGVGLSYDFIQF